MKLFQLSVVLLVGLLDSISGAQHSILQATGGSQEASKGTAEATGGSQEATASLGTAETTAPLQGLCDSSASSVLPFLTHYPRDLSDSFFRVGGTSPVLGICALLSKRKG